MAVTSAPKALLRRLQLAPKLVLLFCLVYLVVGALSAWALPDLVSLWANIDKLVPDQHGPLMLSQFLWYAYLSAAALLCVPSAFGTMAGSRAARRWLTVAVVGLLVGVLVMEAYFFVEQYVEHEGWRAGQLVVALMRHGLSFGLCLAVASLLTVHIFAFYLSRKARAYFRNVAAA